MRIAIDASNLRRGGGVTHLLELLRTADPQRHNFSSVVVFGGAELLSKLPQLPWLTLHHDPLLDRALPARVVWQTTRLDKEVARSKADLLFVPGGNYTGAFRPFVTMCRNLVPFDPDAAALYGISWMRLRNLLLTHLQARTFRKADGLIFLTQSARSAVERHIGRGTSRSTIIPHGVSRRFARPPRPQRVLNDTVSGPPFRWLYVSIVDVYKHQWAVAEAADLLRRKGTHLQVDLVGPSYAPAQRKLDRTLRRLDPEGQVVQFKGAVAFDELEELYHGADGFIFASSCENLPNILLEAMAAGLPIACSNRSSMPEILGDGGAYFDPEDPSSIASALSKLMGDERLREQLAHRAYARAMEHSWERCTDETFAFLHRTFADTPVAGK